jgi:AAA15 family ATPase/GTPase
MLVGNCTSFKNLLRYLDSNDCKAALGNCEIHWCDNQDVLANYLQYNSYNMLFISASIIPQCNITASMRHAAQHIVYFVQNGNVLINNVYVDDIIQIPFDYMIIYNKILITQRLQATSATNYIAKLAYVLQFYLTAISMQLTSRTLWNKLRKYFLRIHLLLQVTNNYSSAELNAFVSDISKCTTILDALIYPAYISYLIAEIEDCYINVIYDAIEIASCAFQSYQVLYDPWKHNLIFNYTDTSVIIRSKQQ